MLVGGRILERIGLQRSFVQVASFALDPKRYRLGALDVIVDRNDTGLDDVRMAFEHLFDFAGEDILSAADEHVVGPTDEEVKAVFVAAEYVAGEIKSVCRDGRGHVRAI